jgi:hypothetical protein
MAVNSGLSACLPGGGAKLKFIKKKRVETNKVIHDDPSTHDCMCCEDWDTDYEPECPCKAVINHCATWANPWDATCEADSVDDDDDDAKVGAPVNCLSCEPADRRMYVRECKCEDTTCRDRATEDIRDTPDNNLEEIEPRNVVASMTAPVAPSKYEPVSRRYGSSGCTYSPGCAQGFGRTRGATLSTRYHRREQGTTDASRGRRLPHHFNLPGEISEDIDLTRAVSRQQLGIPGWLYPNTTMDKGSSDTRGDVQTTRSATARTSQSREINGSLGCSTTNPVQMLENGRRDLPEDNRTNDKRDDLACATDVKYIKEYAEDGDRIPFFWPRKTAQTKGGLRKVSAQDHFDRVIIE